jgi:hypothetical protein
VYKWFTNQASLTKTQVLRPVLMHSWVLLCLQPSVTMWYTLCVPPITRWITFKWEVSTSKSGLGCSLHEEKTLPFQLTRVQCFLKPIMFHASIYWYYVNSGIQWVDLYLLHHLRIQHPPVLSVHFFCTYRLKPESMCSKQALALQR